MELVTIQHDVRLRRMQQTIRGVPCEVCRGGSTSPRRCPRSCRRRAGRRRRGWRRRPTAVGCPTAASSPARPAASARRPPARHGRTWAEVQSVVWTKKKNLRSHGCAAKQRWLVTWNTRPGLHGPEKVVVVMANVPSDGTSSTAESEAQAALHASRNAWVSSVVPSPTAPYARTSNTHGSAGWTGVAGSEGMVPVGGCGATGRVPSSAGGTAGEDTTEPSLPPPLCRPTPRGGFLWKWLLPQTP
jgi:hypothetical protein